MLQHITTTYDLLAHSPRTHVLQIEFTTRCDLKCTYCAVSQAHWRGRDLTLSSVAYKALIESARERTCQVLNLHGHGETTILSDWTERARVALGSGIPVTICSNFAHPHTIEETELLSRFHGITISIDTVCPILFKRLRRGGTLKILLENMRQLAIIVEQQEKGPLLTWCCVLSDQNWRGMKELVEKGLELGVKTFCICNLNLLPTPKNGVVLRHVSTLPERVKIRELLLECQDYCKVRGAEFHLKAGLLDTLE